ncbi:hypothetical protein POJ06DRAFT_267422 [Lipomyces tetrasporus]|uniref:Uncharacterized protein n=1 Tax=Lipomyces tetrasporus TaxID=54092 RepID=A0AAD7VTR3_9ASCO|nr:uncharacterized protein POJ06DRAFT_267422 [Lipomyces tetrasporus]KAJ8101261.1 hypothetical protein POJ06DRAFT_267422 [Lipomyces tetrasporus]
MYLSFTEKKAYQNALDFLIANEPEQRLDFRLPFDCYLALEEEARKRYGDEGYPRVEYSSKSSTVTIYTCQSSLHVKASQFLQRWIEEGVRRELVNHGRGELGERLRPIFDETRNAGDDESGELVKKPDGGLVYFRDFRSVTVVAIEVGVSEKYEKLVADVTLWMEEFHCRTGILFSLKETPRFRYPARQIMNAFSLAVDLEPFYDAIIEIGPNQPFGPYPYRGHNWFGSLDSAFIEILRRDPLTGIVNQSQRVDVIENGHMRLQGDNVDVGLTIEDLFPYGQEDIVGIQQEPIRLDANLLRGYLQEGVVDI